jgi:anhydro-N-acetylmuramic acid kinase
MVYRAIGVMSGSSLDGLDIAFVEFHENAGNWTYELKNAACYVYNNFWQERLRTATSLNALNYQLLHAEYGHYIGDQINKFIDDHHLHYQAALITSHGHTSFHLPSKKMTAQLGDGAAIAAQTQLPVVTDLRSMDVAFGGQGAPIVPVGEKLLFNGYDFFLNIGGIANISFNTEKYIAFDVCAANRVLNMLAADAGKEYDEGGKMAASGKIIPQLLEKLNVLDFYKQHFPKSLSNEFGTEIVYPMIRQMNISIDDSLRTYVEHIVLQIKNSVFILKKESKNKNRKLLVTGGGAFNTFLIQRLTDELIELETEVIVPDENLVKFKEALIMAFIGVLRWRLEYNVFSSVTGALQNSIGGALWMGQEA